MILGPQNGSMVVVRYQLEMGIGQVYAVGYLRTFHFHLPKKRCHHRCVPVLRRSRLLVFWLCLLFSGKLRLWW